jgi:hypothetical protein
MTVFHSMTRHEKGDDDRASVLLLEFRVCASLSQKDKLQHNYCGQMLEGTKGKFVKAI